MGELLALVSTTAFALANIAINSTYRGRANRGGAFLSILMTMMFSGIVWMLFGLRDGFIRPEADAVAWFALGGILTALFGRVFLFASINHLGSVKGAAVKRLNPMFAVLLGVLLLGEYISMQMAAGILLILASFVVLIRHSLREERQAAGYDSDGAMLHRIGNLGYLYGPISALSYASGYVARKQGLLITPDAVLGTLIGAATGIFCFCLLATVFSYLKSDIVRTFSEFNPWLWLAGLLTSVGQLTFFAALKYTTISKMALINSMEVFITMFLARIFFRRDEEMSPAVIVAGVLGVIGTLLVIRY